MTAVDYSWARPSIEALKAAGVSAVGRYVGPAGWGKTITQPEFDALAAAGIEVFLVFEAGATDYTGGENAGAANAHLALQNLPAGYTGPIFVSVDTAVNPADAIPYVRGFAGGIGSAARTGVYGEGGLIVLAHDLGIATAPGWQSASTSFPGNATTTPDTGIQQGLGEPVPGTDADVLLRPLIPVQIPPTAPQPPPTPTATQEADMPVTSTFSYRSGQRDLFQVILGGLVHYWQNVGAPGHEVVAGPQPGSKSGVTATFSAQTPQVDIAGGTVRVTVEDEGGHPYTFTQGQFDPANPAASNGWAATNWLP